MKISGNTTVKQLLAMVKKCKSEKSVEDLRFNIQDALMGAAGNCLDLINEESYIESNGKPYIRFEMVRLFSDCYGYSISPIIQDGQITVIGNLDHFHDELGMSSKNYSAVKGWDDDEITLYPEDRLGVVMARAVNLMLAAHKKLIEDVGVPSHIAKKTAEESWGGPVFAEV